jgi:hypothetical protein
MPLGSRAGPLAAYRAGLSGNRLGAPLVSAAPSGSPRWPHVVQQRCPLVRVLAMPIQPGDRIAAAVRSSSAIWQVPRRSTKWSAKLRTSPPACSRWPHPTVLEQIEAELADVKMSAVEKWRFRQRAGLVRRLLSPAQSRSEPEPDYGLPHPPVGPRQSEKG